MSLSETIKAHPNARGLAIIITNDYIVEEAQLHGVGSAMTPLPGTEKDGENMKIAFSKLGFATYWEKNVSVNKFTKLIREAQQFKLYHTLKYKCIAFVFSGHGQLGDYICMQDGEPVPIVDEVVQPFLPVHSPDMGKFPKLFFIDACRGAKEMKGMWVPRGGNGKDKMREEQFVSDCEPRGVKKLELKLVSPTGNYLIAYSTTSDYKAWEHKEKGGVWLSKLAEKIQTSKSSILDILTEINDELEQEGSSEHKMQQPEVMSRLNKVIHLFESGKGVIM